MLGLSPRARRSLRRPRERTASPSGELVVTSLTRPPLPAERASELVSATDRACAARSSAGRRRKPTIHKTIGAAKRQSAALTSSNAVMPYTTMYQTARMLETTLSRSEFEVFITRLAIRPAKSSGRISRLLPDHVPMALPPDQCCHAGDYRVVAHHRVRKDRERSSNQHQGRHDQQQRSLCHHCGAARRRLPRQLADEKRNHRVQ